MKKETLSNEERARMFAKYMGCKAYFNDGRLHPSDRIKTITGITNSLVIYNEDGYAINGSYKIEQCQLILSPLSEITDEHAIALQKIFNPEYHDSLGGGKKIADDIARSEFISANSASLLIAYDFLRSHAYDIDQLIPQNLAIPKTK